MIDARKASELALLKPQAELKTINDRIAQAAAEGYFSVRFQHHELEYLRRCPNMHVDRANDYIYQDLLARGFKVEFKTAFSDPAGVEITW